MIEPAIGGALRGTPQRSGNDHAFSDRSAKVVAEPQDLLLADRRPLAIQRSPARGDRFKSGARNHLDLLLTG
jgi:hypothetical protein